MTTGLERLKTAQIRALRLFASHWPRPSFGVAHLLAFLSRPLGRGIPEARLATLFPELDPRALRDARRRTWSTFLKVEALGAALEGPGARPVHPRLVATPALTDLRGPLILTSFHIGAYPAIGAAFEQLPGNVLVLHRGGFAPRPGVTLVPPGQDEWERARAFKRALETLRSGRFVFVAVDGGYREDGYESSTVGAPFFGGTITLARGAFALARITGTPIVPLVARWEGSRVAISSAAAIAPRPDDREMAAAAARWLESYLREFPGEVSPRTLEAIQLPSSR